MQDDFGDGEEGEDEIDEFQDDSQEKSVTTSKEESKDKSTVNFAYCFFDFLMFV